MSSSDSNDFVKPLTLHERGFFIQEHLKRQAKADAKWNFLSNNFNQAIHTLKPGVLQNLWVIDNNILVDKGGRLELLLRNDFLCANSEEANKNYIHIRDALRYCEKIENFYNQASNTKNQISDLLKFFQGHLVDIDYTDHTFKFLYEVSLGDLKIIENLAILASEIRCSIPFPTVILADSYAHDGLLEFIRLVSNNFAIFDHNFEIDFNKTLKPSEIKALAYSNWNKDVSSAVCVNGNFPESESRVIQLRKIMHSKKLSVKHPYFSGKIFIKNHMPIIYITESHEKYLKMINIYGAKGIKIPGKTVNCNYLNREWLQNNFAKFGMTRKHFKISTNYKYSKITQDDIFSAFKKELCIFDKDSNCPTQELYNAYELFFKCFYGENPLTFRQFRTRFTIFTNLEVYRPHHNNESNPRCFKGVKINEEKYSKLKRSHKKVTLKCTEKEFTHRLLEAMRNAECIKK